MKYQDILDAISALPYKIEKADGQYIIAVSTHKWDNDTDKALSANGKRIIMVNVKPEGSYSFSGKCFYSIQEDAGTRSVFNGIITCIDQILLLESLTNSFLW